MGKSYKKKGGAEPEKMIINGKEWCECKPTLTTAEKAQEVSNNAEQSVKDFQNGIVDKITATGDGIREKVRDTATNAFNKLMGKNDEIVAVDAQPNANAQPPAQPPAQPNANVANAPPPAVLEGGRRRRTHKRRKHKHNKTCKHHKKSKHHIKSKHHKKSKHKHNKTCKKYKKCKA